MSKSTTIDRLVLSGLALVSALTLAACGSSSSSTTSSGAAAAGPGSSTSQARVELAKCIRSHGVNVPDPGPNGPTQGDMQRLQQRYSQAQLQAALTACRSQLTQAFPQMDLSPAGQAQRRRQALQFAQCMRRHGIDIPDPPTSGPSLGIQRALRSVDQNSPTFKSANAACGSLRPAPAAARASG